MIDELETLVAVLRHRTMAEAAVHLRVTQSAVSKRLAQLEARTGRALLERRGRRSVPTPEGRRLAERAGPLLAELRAVLDAEEAPPARTRLSLGCSESLLASDAAPALREVLDALPGLEIEVHAHRSPLVLERVRAGEYSLGLCAGVTEDCADLEVELLYEEPMVVVPRGLGPLRRPRGRALPLLTIEAHAATWGAIGQELEARPVRIEATVESFACAVQMARAGLAHALVPAGIARAMGVPEGSLRPPPGGALRRPVALVGRTSTMGRPVVRRVAAALKAALPA